MMTNQQLDQLSQAERSAWIESLSEDESAILYCSIGHRYTLVFVALVKHMLAMDIPPNYRLEYLGWLDRRDEAWLSPQIIAAIEPMCEDGYELLREAMKLGHKKGFDTIASWEVFNAFVALNPSLLTAIKMASNRYPFDKRAF
jgi:hypothetical protein